MPVTVQRSLIFSANALIWICLALFLTSCAHKPVVTKTADPVRICPPAPFYSDIPMPNFHGSTVSDLIEYVAALQADARGLRSDRAAIREFCNE